MSRSSTPKNILLLWNLNPPAVGAGNGVKDDDSDDDEAEQQMEQPQQKKKYRPSKKTIGDYLFTEEQVQTLVEFLKECPCLYDKGDKKWCQPKMKEQLWKEAAKLFEGSNWLQVRNFYDVR